MLRIKLIPIKIFIIFLFSANAYSSEPNLPIKVFDDQDSGYLKIEGNISSVNVSREVSRKSTGQSLNHFASKKALLDTKLIELNKNTNKNKNQPNTVSIAKSLGSRVQDAMLEDGYYNERITITIDSLNENRKEDAEANFELKHWNYYKVENGIVSKISSDKYSQATDPTFTVEYNKQSVNYYFGDGFVDYSLSNRQSIPEESMAVRSTEDEREDMPVLWEDHSEVYEP